VSGSHVDAARSYVERPLRQVLCQTMAQRERCGHMSGLLARSSTAGLDEVRDASGWSTDRAV